MIFICTKTNKLEHILHKYVCVLGQYILLDVQICLLSANDWWTQWLNNSLFSYQRCLALLRLTEWTQLIEFRPRYGLLCLLCQLNSAFYKTYIIKIPRHNCFVLCVENVTLDIQVEACLFTLSGFTICPYTLVMSKHISITRGIFLQQTDTHV